jgi:perosamine synthetase
MTSSPWEIPQNARSFGPEYEQAINACLRRGWITEGPEAAHFVARLQEVTGAPHVSLTPNGTLALYMALRGLGLGLGPGDEVIIPDLTFIATATAVLMTGATPVLVDVLPNGLLDPEKVQRAIGPKTRAILPVHLFGFLAQDMSFGDIPTVEDACQALGVLPPSAFAPSAARHRTQAFSFFADKAFTTGEGGAVATTDPALGKAMMYLRNQGRLDRGSFSHPEVGINLRMTDLQCALGNIQLKDPAYIASARRAIWHTYAAHIEDSWPMRLLPPPSGQEETFIPFRVVVVFDAPVAHAVARRMRRQQRVEPREMFVPLHRQPCLSGTGKPCVRMSGTDMKYSEATRLWEHALLLPCWPEMQEKHVVTVLREVLAALGGSAAVGPGADA